MIVIQDCCKVESGARPILENNFLEWKFSFKSEHYYAKNINWITYQIAETWG